MTGERSPAVFDQVILGRWLCLGAVKGAVIILVLFLFMVSFAMIGFAGILVFSACRRYCNYQNRSKNQWKTEAEKSFDVKIHGTFLTL